MNARLAHLTSAFLAPASGAAGRKKPFANVYWFPVAAAYAALILPWSVLAQFGMVAAPAGLSTALGHAHEMLFGFALAVVAGYILGPRTRRQLLALIVLWLAARISFLLWPSGWVSACCNAAFVTTLAWLVAPTYLRTAKKWRNKSVAVIVVLLMLTLLAFHSFSLAGRGAMLYPLLLEALLLLSALMFFMGGRMLAPAIAGHLQSKQLLLKDRVQPRIEGAVLILLAIVMVVNLLPWLPARWLTGGLLILVAGLTLQRLLRWRIWHCVARADLMALLAGYSWLIIGWILLGGAQVLGRHPTAALHAITVGALGTLTFTVMLRTRMHRCLRDPNQLPWAYLGALLMAVAALLRVFIETRWSFVVAALCWSLSFASLLPLLWYFLIEERRGRPQQLRRQLKKAPAGLRPAPRHRPV